VLLNGTAVTEIDPLVLRAHIALVNQVSAYVSLQPAT
jgi:hypothetical protein